MGSVLSRLMVELGLENRGFTKGLDEAERKTKSLASTAKKAGIAVSAAFTGIAVIAAKKLFDIGTSYDTLMDTIRIGTGATGDALDALGQNALNVFKAIPTSMEIAGQAVAELNTRTGATGKVLEELSKTQIELARITGTDLQANIESTSKVMQQWGIAAEDQVATLDKLFRASQAAGIPVDVLASELSKYGPILRQMGFGLDESVALLSTMNKAGLQSSQVIAGLRTAFAKFADQGLTDMGAALKNTFELIRSAPNAAEAGRIAIETFGSRSGAALAESIRSGTLAYEDLLAAVSGGSDTILGVAADTNDWRENLQILQNQITTKLLPVANRLFGEISKAVMPGGPVRNFAESVQRVIVALDKTSPIFRKAGIALGVFLLVLGPLLVGLTVIIPVLSTLGVVIGLLLGPLGLVILAVVALTIAYKKNFLGIQGIVKRFFKFIKGLDWKKGMLGDFIDIFQRLAKGDFTGAIHEISMTLKQLGDSLASMLERAGLHRFAAVVRSTFYDLAAVVRGVFMVVKHLINGEWKQAWERFLVLVRDVVHLLWNRMILIPALILDVFEMIDWGAVGSGLMDGAAAAWEIAWDEIKKWPRAFYDWFTSPSNVQRYYNAGNAIIEGLAKGISFAWGWLEGWVKDLPGRVVRYFEVAYNAFYNVGHYIISGLASGIGSAWNWLVGWLQDRWNALPGYLRKIWEIASPSRVFERIGAQVPPGLARGIEGAMPVLTKAIQSMGQSGMSDLSMSLSGYRGSSLLAGGSTSETRMLNIDPGAIVVQAAENPEATAKAILRAIRQTEAGSY